jgi:hypothetical protein
MSDKLFDSHPYQSSLIVHKGGNTYEGYDIKKTTQYNKEFDNTQMIDHTEVKKVIRASKGVYGINDRKELLIGVSRSPPKDIPHVKKSVEHDKRLTPVGSIHDTHKSLVISVDLDKAKQELDTIESDKIGGLEKNDDLLFNIEMDPVVDGGYGEYFEVCGE